MQSERRACATSSGSGPTLFVALGLFVGACGSSSGAPSRGGDALPDAATRPSDASLAERDASRADVSTPPADASPSDAKAPLHDASTPDAAGGTVIFTQPSYYSISSHFLAPIKTYTNDDATADCPMGDGYGLNPESSTFDDEFVFVAWECPQTVAGFVANTHAHSAYTGLTALSAGSVSDLGPYQIGYENTAASSIVQVYGNEVGVYLNSADLTFDPSFSTQNKMITTPQVKFPAGQHAPFALSTGAATFSLDLKVPTIDATGASLSYAVLDVLFYDSTHTNVKTGNPVGVTIDVTFITTSSTDGGSPECFTDEDVDSGNYVVNCGVGTVQPYFTATPSLYQTRAWSTYTTYSTRVSALNFQKVLDYVVARNAGFPGSTSPPDYYLAEVHLNGEMHHIDPASLTTTLGYSLRNLQIMLE